MRSGIIAVLAALAAGLAGCVRSGGEAAPVKIAPAIRTRVTGLHFDKDDQIGLSIVRTTGSYVENALLVFDGTTFSAPGLFWYDGEAEASTLTAYHPYSETGVPAEFAVATDQRSGCGPSDLLGAVKKGVLPGSAPVGMVFSHLMTQLSVIVANSSGAAVTELRIGGFVPTGLVDLENLAVQVKGGDAAAEVMAWEETAGTRYRAILVPQEAQLTVTAATSDGKVHGKTLAAALTGGKIYDLTLEITKQSVEASLSGEIKDWIDGGSLDGGNEGGSGGGDGGQDNPVTDPGTVTHDGQTYRTRTIGGRVWMAENLRNMPAGVELEKGVWNPAGGASAVSSQGMLYDYATATGGAAAAAGSARRFAAGKAGPLAAGAERIFPAGAARTSGAGSATRAAAGEVVRGMCPAGWHIPDAEELAALIGADCGADFFCCAGYRIVTASANRYGDASSGYLISSTLAGDNCKCLKFSTVGPEAQLSERSVNYGLSLRCVKDVQ